MHDLIEATKKFRKVGVESFQRMAQDCRDANSGLTESMDRETKQAFFCGIAPWAYNSALRVQTLGVTGVRKRDEGFRFRPDDITAEERREQGRRRTVLTRDGGPDGTKSQPLEVLAQLCRKKG